MKRAIPPRERIIVALDLPTGLEARLLAERLADHIGFFKIGLQLFLAEGFPLVDWFLGQGFKVMLDLKFLDIPRTVSLAMAEAAKRGVHLATVHAHTSSMLRAAVAGAGNVGVLGVTVLTSMGADEMRELHCDATVESLVLARAGYALGAGCAGVVASAREASLLRRAYGDDFLIVTPGIRSTQHSRDDQRRIMTPGRAIASGADHLVVGRPISQAPDPADMARRMLGEVTEVLEALAANGQGD